MGAESERVAGFGGLEDGLRQAGDWYAWGPYVSERQWGTVREDYSPYGEARDCIAHDEARSYAYRWGENGMAGFCDVEQRLCLGLALWNGRDPILKERAFGLTGSQGNHGDHVNGVLVVSGRDSGLGGCGWVIGAVHPRGDGINQIAGPAGRFTVITVESETAGL